MMQARLSLSAFDRNLGRDDRERGRRRSRKARPLVGAAVGQSHLLKQTALRVVVERNASHNGFSRLIHAVNQPHHLIALEILSCLRISAFLVSPQWNPLSRLKDVHYNEYNLTPLPVNGWPPGSRGHAVDQQPVRLD